MRKTKAITTQNNDDFERLATERRDAEFKRLKELEYRQNEEHKLKMAEAPTYYNLSLIAGNERIINGVPQMQLSPASFNEINQNDILRNTSNYNIAISRMFIPTNSIPRIIPSVVIGQSDINKLINVLTLAYRVNGTNTGITYAESLNVQFISEYSGLVSTGNIPRLPQPPINSQDIESEYYYIYNVESILEMFNNTFKTLYGTFRANLLAITGVAIPADKQPYFSYDVSTQIFSFNAPKTEYNDSVFPRIEAFSDGYTTDMIMCPTTYIANRTSIYPDPLVNKNMISLFKVKDLYDNAFTRSMVEYIFMSGDQSPLQIWNGINRIVITVPNGMSTKSEYDIVPTPFDKITDPSYQKPSIPILADFEVDKDSWAKNSLFIQYTASSITQMRLISLTSDNPIKNFTLSVFWVDNFGNRRPLYLPLFQPITIKLAFFKKNVNYT